MRLLSEVKLITKIFELDGIDVIIDVKLLPSNLISLINPWKLFIEWISLVTFKMFNLKYEFEVLKISHKYLLDDEAGSLNWLNLGSISSGDEQIGDCIIFIIFNNFHFLFIYLNFSMYSYFCSYFFLIDVHSMKLKTNMIELRENLQP